MSRAIAVCAAILFVHACADTRTRPPAVSHAAVWVEGGKWGYWQQCEVMDSRIRCTIWNEGGKALLDEEFRPFDGGVLPTSTDLQLRRGGACTGPYQVCLKNGRILLPVSRYDELKAFLEGRRLNPNEENTK